MKFSITILGCGAATPTLKRNPSAQIVNLHDKLFLIDCAEGTQVQLRKARIRFQKIHHIFISHLHGDHYLGLMGLISSMHLLGRTRELHIFGPVGLKEVIDVHLEYSFTQLNFELHFHIPSYDSKELIFEDNSLEVFSLPLKHRIPCTGFLFKEKRRELKIKKELIAEKQLLLKEIVTLKKGEDCVRENGELLKSEDFTVQPPAQRSYAYCSDTAYFEDLIPHIKEVDLLYHESTFSEEMAQRAKDTFHSTAKQAATIALKAKVGQLVLGHFSSRYPKTDDLLNEALAVFPHTIAAKDGLNLDISHNSIVDKS